MAIHRVSVVTATLNRPSLRDACNSVDSQTARDWHHYVLGDGMLPVDYSHSQRTTLGFTRPLGALEPSVDKPNGTPNPILRWAIKNLELGEFLCFLDDDNAYKPEFIDTMTSTLADSNAGIAICALEDCREDDTHDGYPELGRCDNSALAVRTCIAKEIGFPKCHPREENIQDFEFIRACADRYGWIRCPEKLVYFGLHSATPPPAGRAQ